MDYSRFIKRFELPTGFSAPTGLTYQNIIARPLTRKDLEDDMEGVNSSLELIRRTRGGLWPSEPVDEDFDFLDLAWHEREFREAGSFAYVVYEINGRYLGCFYLYPIGVRTPLNEELLKYDVDASWWVTTTAYQSGFYEKLYSAMQQWLAESFPFNEIYYSNKEIPS